MELKDIFHPISPQLNEVKEELLSQFCLSDFVKHPSVDLVGYFFRASGKQLRPALVLLSANGVPRKREFTREQSVELALAVELIHSASLIHDDIVDDAKIRRGQSTINEIFDTKMAVLSGDYIFARAFSILSRDMPKNIPRILSDCVERMCCGEINTYGKTVDSFSEYIQLIEDKTAGFMSACCQCGAELAGTDSNTIKALGYFGLNFGISYQLFDDYTDQDVDLSFDLDVVDKAVEYAGRARENIAPLKETPYKRGFEGLLDYLIEKNIKASMANY